MKTSTTLADLKFDLLKITEPYDGLLEVTNTHPVRKLFVSYLRDLQADKMIYDFSIDIESKTDTITFNVNVRLQNGRAPKKLRIHVRTFIGSSWNPRRLTSHLR